MSEFVPILGIPCISRDDILRSCIATIDHPVRLAVIDNSPDGSMRDAAPASALYMKPFTNLGVAASWNTFIRSFPDDPYWLIANADTFFGRGDISRIMDADRYGWTGINGDWRLMKITRETVERVGLFDENLFPAYCEDADYERRCDLAGVPWGFIDGSSEHLGSITIQDAAYAAKNAKSFPANVAYYRDKWGTDVRGAGGYDTPFDSGRHVSEWTLDIDRLAELRW